MAAGTKTAVEIEAASLRIGAKREVIAEVVAVVVAVAG